MFLKLTTDDGVEGIGEVYGVPFSPDKATLLVEDIVERYVISWNPFQTEKLWRTIYSSGYSQHPDLTLVAVLSGIEIARWDIVGKALGQPIYNLLGGQVHEKLRSYTYLYAAQGFTAVKFDPVGRLSALDPRQLSLEVLENAELVTKNVREAVGSKCDLLIGTHGQMTRSRAIRLAKRLEQFEPLWFEEPVPPENRSEMARVAHFTSIPIASGERLTTKYEYVELLERQAAAILQPALARMGGIMEAKKIAIC